MPEGDTVHQLAGYLDRRLSGRWLDYGLIRRPTETTLDPARVESVRALGKHLLIALDDGRTVRSHLGMHGSWHRYPDGAPWPFPASQAAIELHCADQAYLCFHPMQVQILVSQGLAHRDLASRLGPDLVSGRADYPLILTRARRLSAPDTPLVDLLLNQRIAAGIGNVYKSELLFLLGLHPLRTLAATPDDRLESLYRRGRALLHANLDGGPRVTRRADGARLWVYRRRGRPCLRCGTTIRSARLGRDARSTYWCARCQPRGA